jgi:hypothetical protein
MQTWSYDVASPKDIEKYIEHYKLTSDDDKRFLLVEIIIQAINDQERSRDFLKYWDSVKEILKEEFVIHEYTFFYWASFGDQKTSTITPNIRTTGPNLKKSLLLNRFARMTLATKLPHRRSCGKIGKVRLAI